MKSLPFETHPARRWPAIYPVALVMAAAVSVALLGLVTGLFAQASNMPWLAATPTNEIRMAQCAGTQGTAAKRACAEQVVASVVRESDSAASGVRVARSDTGPAATVRR